jgi:hypothetical protein
MNPRVKLILCLFIISEVYIPIVEKKNDKQNITMFDMLVYYATHFTIKVIIAQEIIAYVYSLFEM